jgi:hypothetical protein
VAPGSEALAQPHLQAAQKLVKMITAEKAAESRMKTSGLDATMLTSQVALHTEQALKSVETGLTLCPSHPALSALLIQLGGKPKTAFSPTTSSSLTNTRSTVKLGPVPRLELLQQVSVVGQSVRSFCQMVP